MLTAGEIAFVREHLEDDVHALLLSASKYPGKDIPKCVRQIEGLRKIRDKVPEWFACTQVYIPSLQAAEQCSSAYTASYKNRFVNPDDPVLDITGGLGVDSFYFSKNSDQVIYAEQDMGLCRAAEHNFRVLGAGDRIRIVNSPAEQLWDNLPDISQFSLVYADPSRRDTKGRRLYDLQQYSPDITRLQSEILKRSRALLVKVSPMADISRALVLLPATSQVHVVSVDNECKELLFLVKAREDMPADPLIVCSAGFSFYRSEEIRAASLIDKEYDHTVVKEGSFLYEPEVSVMKAGAFALIAVKYGVKKIHRNSHLYFSDRKVASFPGRKFRIREVIPFTSGNIRHLVQKLPKANITVRNFPLTVEQIRMKTKIAEGGHVFLFATTVRKNNKDTRILIHATKWEETI
ncbi:MAG TPA: SAM-dependent methyltransferase [Bacteroidales bacterium]|nr:SAM-dependent methyltransferase [Bacteroidales bacterium]HRW95312.1 SAM-dependent methyltransferase [Bacteroidales bacterium]